MGYHRICTPGTEQVLPLVLYPVNSFHLILVLVLVKLFLTVHVSHNYYSARLC